MHPILLWREFTFAGTRHQAGEQKRKTHTWASDFNNSGFLKTAVSEDPMPTVVPHITTPYCSRIAH